MASSSMSRKVLVVVATTCFIVASVATATEQRQPRQLFSASGLVFPGPPGTRRRAGVANEQPQAQAQVGPKSPAGANDDDAPFLPVAPRQQARPQQQGRPQQQQQARRPQQPQQQARQPGGPLDRPRARPGQVPQLRQPVPVSVNTQERPRPVVPAPVEARQDSAPERIVPNAPASLAQERADAPLPRSPAPLPEPVRPPTPLQRPQPPFQLEVDEEEERSIDSVEDEELEEFVPKQPIRAPIEVRQPVTPVEARRPQPVAQRPQPTEEAPRRRQPASEGEPRRRQPAPKRPAPAEESESRSVDPAVQPKRPNYPSNYKPRPSQLNELEEEPQGEEEDPELADEEEEAKPDKLQLLLMETKFDCLEKKDGYYADEAVECEVFHYCQDKVRHSWLCPEGASFHQVHLICMPSDKDNICKKSTDFHFVNDYLYKAVEDEDGNNSTFLYSDRYYPEGYEHGVPFDMESVKKPENPQYLPGFMKRPLNQPQRQRPAGGRPNSFENRRQDSRVPLPTIRRPTSMEDYDDEPIAPPRRPEIRQRPMAIRPPVEMEEEDPYY